MLNGVTSYLSHLLIEKKMSSLFDILRILYPGLTTEEYEEMIVEAEIANQQTEVEFKKGQTLINSIKLEKAFEFSSHEEEIEAWIVSVPFIKLTIPRLLPLDEEIKLLTKANRFLEILTYH